jgi:natural product biosynthesis luciferase-like monooxygenase protein/amino acid adenylation domain-containing protein
MLTKDNVKYIAKLSPLQEGIFYYHLLDPTSLSYFTQTSFHITGELDIPLFHQCFQQMIDRYDVLRAVFIQHDVMPPRQIILKHQDADIVFQDLTDTAAGVDKDVLIQALIEKDRKNLFDPGKGKLLRLCLAKLGENEYHLIWSHHHILMDGWCLSVIIEDFFAVYNGAVSGHPVQLPEVTPYLNYLKYLDQVDRHASLEYWRKYLSGYESLAAIPAALPDSAAPYLLAELPFQLDKATTDGLTALSRKYKATLNTVIQCIWGVLLGKYNNANDAVFAAVVSGRPPEIAGIEKMIGLFINTIPVRIRTDRSTVFGALVKEVQQQAIESMPHHYVQLADVQHQSDLGTGLLNHVMIFENYPVAEKIQGEMKGTGLQLQIANTGGFEQSNYDFNITLYPADVITVKFSYNKNRFSEDTVNNIRAHFIQLTAQVVAHPEWPVHSMVWLTAAEQHQQQELFSGALNLPVSAGEDTIVQLFETQVAQTPDAVAIVHGEQQLSYRELNEAANRIASYLRAAWQVGSGQLVGLLAERSVEMVTGLLGILKAGAGYVPIDASYPEERITYMLADAGIHLLLTGSGIQSSVPVGVISISLAATTFENSAATNPARAIGYSAPAYMIYTSGSTGAPKGVIVTHGNAMHFFAHVRSQYGCGPGTYFPFVASHSFDISLFQLLTPLLTGGASVIADRAMLDDMAAFTGLLKTVTMIDTVPGVYNLLADYIMEQEPGNTFGHIEKIFIGGDVIPDHLLKKLAAIFSGATIVVTYGPTEGTIFCTTHPYVPGAINVSSRGALIGKPVSGSLIYILDSELSLLPSGVTGEICIGGAGVAVGYHQQDTLTAEKFVGNPYRTGDRLYRTGDLGRWTPDGEVVFMGRRDTQVKIRGFRIETGEIETALASHPLIREAVVVAKEDAGGSKYLAAYLVTDEALTPTVIRTYLLACLPDYMIPAYFISLAQLPLTSNGKVDRNALPAPDEASLVRSRAYEAARNDTEERLVKIWEEVLGRTGTGIHDNFFEAGGHSLKAIQLVSRIRKVFESAIVLKDIFSYPDIASQAAYLQQAAAYTFEDIPQIAPQESYPLSHAQRRFWILSQFSDSSAAYNVPGVLLFEGVLEPALLEQVLTFMVARHESLRTVFRENAGGEVRQYILPVTALHLAPAYADVSKEKDPYEALRQKFAAEQHIGFDLSEGPLLRTSIIKVSEKQYALFYTMHHIMSDGWSMEVLSKEVIGAYNAFKQGAAPEWQPLPLQYKDYAAWQSAQLEKEAFGGHERYWLEQFSGSLPVLDLPADKKRPPVKTHRGSSVTVTLPPALITAMKSLCLREGATLFMGLLAGLKALFYRYTGQEDIIVGSPIAGREHKDLEGQIGLYINSLALRTRFSGTDNFTTLLRKEKKVLMDAYTHQLYPYDMLVEALQLNKDMSRLPLFDIMVGMQNQASTNIYDKSVGFDGLAVTPMEEMKQERSQFDLLFSFVESADDLLLSLTYNTDIYDHENITRLCTHFEQLLREITEDPLCPLHRIKYLSAAEETMLLQSFNNTAVDNGDATTMIQRFEWQVAQTPQNIALIDEEKEYTYQQLNEKANQLGHYLRKKYDLRPDDLVGILTDRSDMMMIGILGILKAGAAYVPVDPSYPGDRIKYILTEAAPKIVLTLSEYVFDIIDYYSGELFALDIQLDTLEEDRHNPPALATPSDLAYVIYTSGSTGNPKGVMLSQQGVVNMSLDQVRQFGVTATDRVLQFASLSFDASVSEYCMAFFAGAALVMINKNRIGEHRLFSAYLRQKAVTVVTLPPSYLQVLDETDLAGLKVLITAGQEADRTVALRYSQFLRYYNAYGPTENSVCATIYQVKPADRFPGSVPIGKPIANTQIYILDNYLQLLPAGVPGEIYISGEGLAKGYLNNESLTAEKFIPHPFNPGARIYRTGDIGRWSTNGNVVFLGRKDQQVKIRGYRIELEEIQHVLLRHHRIEEAVVQMWPEANGNGSYLAAYVVAGESLDPHSLHDFLATTLPEYMIPAAFVQLPALPLTHNGKIDRKALPDPATTNGEGYTPPANTLEVQLVAMWEELLGRTPVGIHDNFFSLGGHSLKAMQLLSRIRKDLQVKITLNDLFAYTTVHTQGVFISTAEKDAFSSIPLVEVQESYPLSHAQQRFWILSQFAETSLAYNVPVACMLEGDFDITLFNKTLSFLFRRHESLRTVFREDAHGAIRQYIMGEEERVIQPAYIDISSSTQPMGILQQLFVKEQLTAFDLQQGPLISIKIVKVREDAHALFYTMHHIISDGWSMQVLIKEMTAVYNAYKEGVYPDLPPLRIQYKDFAAWQSSGQHDSSLKAHEEYWLEHLSGELPVLHLPHAKQRPPVKTHHGHSVSKVLPAAAVAGLQKLCKDEGASLFMGLLAGLKAILHLHTGQEDIIVGSPIAGREQGELENQIGLFLNTLALRTTFKGTDSFRSLLRKEKEVLLNAYSHQLYPFDSLVDQLPLNRDMSRSPLFDVLVIMQNHTTVAGNNGAAAFNGLQISQLEAMERITSQFDLEFSFVEAGEEVHFLLNYNTDIYDQSYIDALCAHFERLLAFAGSQPECAVNKLDYLSVEEKDTLLTRFNDTPGDYDLTATVVSLFEKQAAATPHHIAIVFENKSFTYEQLNEQANRLADCLRTVWNIQAGDLVGLMAERSEMMLVGLLGILKAGAAYVPVDPTYPPERIAYILKDSNARLLLAGKQPAAGFQYEGAVVLLDAAVNYAGSALYQPAAVTPADLCYVIYTSGSTGQPKGVMICHRNVVNFFAGMDKALPLNSDDCMLALTSTSFDISVLELLWTLCRGAEVVIHPSDISLSNLDRYVGEEEPVDFSLFFFSSYNNTTVNKYQLLMEAARYADEHGFKAVWTPERHFHEFGGLYPNPSVISAALAATTRHLSIRSGSVVAPLHDAIRIAEEWSVVDNLSGGRVGLSFASGWNANDFVLSGHDYADRHKKMFDQIEEVKRLWRGEAVQRENGLGQEVSLQVYPRPVQAALPVWVTAAGSEATFISAGAIGANVLTHFLGQDLEELAGKINLYRSSRLANGHSGPGIVTVMLHTYVGEDAAAVAAAAEGPFISYLKSSIGLSKIMLEESGLREEDISEELKEKILKNSFKRYASGSALIGTKSSCAQMVGRLKGIGVNEIACLVDFGIAEAEVLEGLEHLNELRKLFAGKGPRLHKPVTVMQSTPSFIRLVEEDGHSGKLLGSLRMLLLGGEALPAPLLQHIRETYQVPVYNMYGPTETTVWSCVCAPSENDDRVSIGRPILNTQIYILNNALQLVATGVPGELYIGGDGLSPGYLHRPELTAERFIPHPFHEGRRLYKTGDLARWLPDGQLEYLGRLDDQLKVRGHRIEPGEIEAVLLEQEDITEAIIITDNTATGDVNLVACIVSTAAIDVAALRTVLARRLPAYMIPAQYILLTRLPLTPNGKVDKKALKALLSLQEMTDIGYVPPANETEEKLTAIWEVVLGRSRVGITDNFFTLGGQSLSGMRMINMIRNEFNVRMGIVDLFNAQTIQELAVLISDINRVIALNVPSENNIEKEEIIL